MPGWRPKPKAAPKPRVKGIYIGAPAHFKLELACQHLDRAFGGWGCYLVGSCLQRPDWRDIDVRYILDDEEFRKLFPDVDWTTDGPGSWEFDARWLLLTTSLSDWLKAQTGLPIDFQFQPQSHSSKRHPGPRNAVGLIMAPRSPSAAP